MGVSRYQVVEALETEDRELTWSSKGKKHKLSWLYPTELPSEIKIRCSPPEKQDWNGAPSRNADGVSNLKRRLQNG